MAYFKVKQTIVVVVVSLKAAHAAFIGHGWRICIYD